MTQREKAEELRRLHAAPEPLVLVNAWDAVSARVVADAGASAIATASWSIAAARGYEDGEQIPLDEMLDSVRVVARAVDLPVTADLERGFGDAGSTVARAIEAGAVGCNLEDSTGSGGLVPVEAHVAAVAAARAAYLAGFASTSNLQAGRRYGIPTSGTAAHAFTLLHDSEAAAFKAQVETLGVGTTLLVDTYDIAQGIRTAIEVAGPGLGAVRIDSGDLTVLARQARDQLDSLGATGTRIVLSGDLDEWALAALTSAPVDAYGVGTSVVTGSGAPTAGMVYKLVEVDGRPVAKRSEHKSTHGGRKTALRRHRATGTATEEVLVPARARPDLGPNDRLLQRPLMRGGERVAGLPALDESREQLRRGLRSVPWEGLKLSRGEPALPTVLVEGSP
jgi:hypothetical protein